MSNLEVIFQVPPEIEMGLASGVLQRVGGVIVTSASKQVVAWLRDGTVSQVLDTGSQMLPGPLNTILSAARTGASLYDNHLTRQALHEATTQMQVATTLATFTAGGQVLNLALAAVSIQATMQRLDRLSEEVRKLGEEIYAEFTRDRIIGFQTSLEAARDVFGETRRSENLDNAIRSAVDGLYNARQHFLYDFDKQLSSHQQGNFDTHHLTLAQHYLTLAMYAEVTRLRCYLAGEEMGRVSDRLAEQLEIFNKHSQRLVQHWLGEHPAIYIHKAITDMDVDRFFQIQHWLRKTELPEEVDRAYLLAQVINDLRADFWNPDILHLVNDELDILRRVSKPAATKIDELGRRLDHAEIVIENFDRLLGFEL